MLTQTPQNGSHEEGASTKAIEEQTSKVPSGTYLTFAIGSIVASAALMIAGKKQAANFVGQWAPTLLILGLYNKLVKQMNFQGA